MFDKRERVETLDYPDDEWLYYRIAKEWGWTPQQVDEAPAHLLDMMMLLSNAEREWENDKNKP